MEIPHNSRPCNVNFPPEARVAGVCHRSEVVVEQDDTLPGARHATPTGAEERKEKRKSETEPVRACWDIDQGEQWNCRIRRMEDAIPPPARPTQQMQIQASTITAIRL